MSETWSAVDDYLDALLVGKDEALEAALEAAVEAGLPQIQVAPNQGKLLQLLARLAGARRILEIGTLGGYSTIWLARALPPGGHLLSLELEQRHAEVARANLARAGLTEQVEVRVGPALESLAALHAEGAGPYDFVFIDADKPAYPEYFAWAMRLSAAGSVIVADNVVRQGKVADPDSRDAAVLGVRAMLEEMAAEPRALVTAVQTVGSKGYDGFAFALVTD